MRTRDRVLHSHARPLAASRCTARCVTVLRAVLRTSECECCRSGVRWHVRLSLSQRVLQHLHQRVHCTMVQRSRGRGHGAHCARVGQLASGMRRECDATKQASESEGNKKAATSDKQLQPTIERGESRFGSGRSHSTALVGKGARLVCAQTSSFSSSLSLLLASHLAMQPTSPLF